MGEVRRLLEDLSRLVEGDAGTVRHMTNETAYVALVPGLKVGTEIHKTKMHVNETEKAFEQVRKEKFPHLPSRLDCLFLAETLKDVARWHRPRDTWGPSRSVIYEVAVTGRAVVVDGGWYTEAVFRPQQAESYADEYWSGRGDRDGNYTFWELLVDGEAHVTKVLGGPPKEAPRG